MQDEERIARPIDAAEWDDATLERLAKSILAQATAHALGRPFYGEWPDADERRDAAEWFRRADEGFRLICRVAGIAPEFARRTVLGRLSGAGGHV